MGDFGGGDGYVGLDRRSYKPNLARGMQAGPELC